MINNIKNKQRALWDCPDCGTELQCFHNMKYCQSCKKCVTMFDDTVKQTDTRFKPKLLETKSSPITKIQTHIRNISCNINVKFSQSQINQISKIVLAFHRKRGINTKGYKQETAAIIYRQYEDQIRMSIIQFCQKINITRKKFNKMFLHYDQILKQNYLQQFAQQGNYEYEISNQINDNNNTHLKLQQAEQHSDIVNEINNIKQQQLFQEELVVKNEQIQKKNRNNQFDSLFAINLNKLYQQQFVQEKQAELLQKTLSKLYDRLFTSLYFSKLNISLTIVPIIKKGLSLSQLYFKYNNTFLKSHFRAPCIIYAVMKENGHKIKLQKYIEIVKQKLDVTITSSMINKFVKLMRSKNQKMEQDQQASSPTNYNRNNQSQSKESHKSD